MTDEKEVIVEIKRGVVVSVRMPKGIRVKIIDRDIEGIDQGHITKYDGEDAMITEYGYWTL